MTAEERIQEIHGKIDAAAQRAGRAAKEVQLVCVSKMHPIAEIEQVISAGERVFGENRVDELLEKSNNITKDVQWHMIGQLQTNKVRKLIGHLALVQSVDRESLLRELHRRSVAAGVVTEILLQVDFTHAPGRGGAGEDAVRQLLEQAYGLSGVRVRGLMHVAPLGVSERQTRESFARVYRLYRALHEQDAQLSILSMGMSGDYEAAIEEGSNMVRIGTAVFGTPRKPLTLGRM